MQEHTENRLEMGKAFLRTNMLEEALGCFAQALDDEEKRHEALFYLGVTSFKKGDFGNAVDYFKKVLEIRSDSVHIYNNLALSLEKAHHEKEALLVYDTALEIAPSSSLLLANRGILRFKLQEFEGAVSDLRRALKKRAGIAFLHFYMALALIKIQHMSEAREHLEQALAIAPDDATILNNLGYLSLRQGLHDQARKYLASAIRRSSGLRSSYVNMARLYTERGKLEMSLLMLRKAFPEDLEEIKNHLLRLSDFLARCGRGEEAGYLSRRAHDLTNGNSRTAEGLESSYET